MNSKHPHDNDSRAKLERLLDEALALPESGRRAFIEGIADATLRAELSSLLRDATRAESFFAHLEPVLQNIIHDASEESATNTSDHSAIDSLLGQRVGHYRIDAQLGEGGMGVVYRATDTRLQRTVALKFLPPRLSNDARAKERFLIEARAAAALDHPNICTIHEIGGDAEGRSFIAMAYYPGETLEHTLQRGPLPAAQALDYTLQIARGLSAAHDRQIIHRDVKPGNVVITDDGVVKLLDFGIARMHDVTVSLPGLTPGTIAYMSPEQLTARGTDARTDLWSLGVVLYEMCTGVRPFHRGDHGSTLHAILHEHPAAVANGTDIPPRIWAIIDRLLQKDPNARYSTATELTEALSALLSSDPSFTINQSARTRHPSRVTRHASVTRHPSLRAVGAIVAALVVTWLALGVAGRTEPTRILVADVAGDTSSGNIISDRLRARLASPKVNVAGRPSLNQALVRMGRDSTVRLSPAIARELALREGFKAFIHVTVDRIGNAFLIGAILVASETGDLIDHQLATAMNEAEIASATDRVAEQLRTSLSKSLVSIRGTKPLLALTADSMSALRRHLEAVQANRSGDFATGAAIERQTIAIDPNLADAHQTLGFALEQLGERAGRAQLAYMNAHELSPRLTPYERFSVQGDYYWQVEGNLRKAETALRQYHTAMAELKPGRVLNRRSWGMTLMLTGNLVEAEKVMQEGNTLAACPVTKSQLVTVLYALNRNDDARDLLRDAVGQWPTNPLLGMDQAHFLAVERNYRGAHDAAQRLHGGYTLPFALRAEGVFDAVEGRYAEALVHFDELRSDHLRNKLLAPAIEVSVAIGRARLAAGDTADARKRVSEFLMSNPLTALPPEERPYLTLALFRASVRDAAGAREMLTAYDSLVPARFKGPDRWMQQRVRAAIFMAEDSAASALRELVAARHTDRLWGSWLDNLLFTIDERPELARVYDKLGKADSAIAVYERYLNKRVLYRAELDAFERGHALLRLAQLYEGRNDAASATRKREELSRLWQNADR